MQRTETKLREEGSLGNAAAGGLRPGSHQDTLTISSLSQATSFPLLVVAFPTKWKVWLLTDSISFTFHSLSHGRQPDLKHSSIPRPKLRGKRRVGPDQRSLAWANEIRPRMGQSSNKKAPYQLAPYGWEGG